MDYYNEIKNELINNEINKKVKSYSINRSDLNTYFNVVKMLSEAGMGYRKLNKLIKIEDFIMFFQIVRQCRIN